MPDTHPDDGAHLRISDGERHEVAELLREAAAQGRLDLSGNGIVADPLEDFAQNDVGQSEALAIEFRVQPIRLGIASALQVVDPDGCIDDHHAYFASRSRRDLFRSPSHAIRPRSRRIPA